MRARVVALPRPPCISVPSPGDGLCRRSSAVGVCKSDFQKPQMWVTAERHYRPSQTPGHFPSPAQVSPTPHQLLQGTQTLGVRDKRGVSQRSFGKNTGALFCRGVMRSCLKRGLPSTITFLIIYYYPESRNTPVVWDSNTPAPSHFPLSSSSLLNTFISFCFSLSSSLTGFPSPPSLYCQPAPQALMASLNRLCCWHGPNLDTLPSPRSQSRLFLLQNPVPNSSLQEILRDRRLDVLGAFNSSLPKAHVVDILEGCPGPSGKGMK